MISREVYYEFLNAKPEDFTGIKKAVTEANNAQLYYRVYGDIEDKTVWVKEYVSCDSWSEYHSDTIFCICKGRGRNSGFAQDKLTMKELRKAIQCSIEYVLSSN